MNKETEFNKRLEKEKCDYLYTNKESVMGFSFIVSMILVFIFYGKTSNFSLVIWSVIQMTYITFRIIKFRIYAKKKAQNESLDTKEWINYYFVASIIGGLIWGGGGLFLSDAQSGSIEITIFAVLIVGVTAASIPGSASSFKSCLAFCWGALLPSIITTFRIEYDEYKILAIMFFIHSLSMVGMCKKISDFICSNIFLTLKNTSLTSDLKEADESVKKLLKNRPSTLLSLLQLVKWLQVSLTK